MATTQGKNWNRRMLKQVKILTTNTRRCRSEITQKYSNWWKIRRQRNNFCNKGNGNTFGRPRLMKHVIALFSIMLSKMLIFFCVFFFSRHKNETYFRSFTKYILVLIYKMATFLRYCMIVFIEKIYGDFYSMEFFFLFISIRSRDCHCVYCACLSWDLDQGALYLSIFVSFYTLCLE